MATAVCAGDETLLTAIISVILPHSSESGQSPKCRVTSHSRRSEIPRCGYCPSRSEGAWSGDGETSPEFSPLSSSCPRPLPGALRVDIFAFVCPSASELCEKHLYEMMVILELFQAILWQLPRNEV